MKRLLELSLNVLCVILVVVGAFAYIRDRRSADPAKRTAVNRNVIKIGQRLVVPNLTFRSKRSLVLILSTSCHFCELSAPFYQRLLKEQRSGTWQSILLFPQPIEQATSYVNRHNYYSPTTTQADLSKLGVSGTPTLLLVDENGIVLDEWIGLLAPKEEADVATHLGIDPHVVSHGTTSQDSSSVPEVLTDELTEIMIRHRKATILDVRDRKEFSEGHLAGARNIPADELHVRASHELSKKIPIFLFCNFAPWCQASGVRTLCSSAEEELGGQGFTKVRHIRDRLEVLSKEDFPVNKGLPYPVSSM